MKFISLFAGIGGFDLALERAEMVGDSMVEIDKNCQNILRRHFPNSRIYNDVQEVGTATHERKSIDLICGGFPCQDLSVAGKRAGLAGERSGLWFEFARIIDELEPRWIIAENVPGLLSRNNGRDFVIIVQRLAELGYGVVWRVLDAQYFGVPQRRRRVFIVASLGNGCAAEVLFESEGMFGDTPASGEAGKEVAYSIRANPSHSGDKGDGGINAEIVNDGEPSLTGLHEQPIISVAGALHSGTPGRDASDSGNGHLVNGIRRLTPTECERLQGFPDGWTDGQSDSVRYRQLGNAVAVPVVEWIGKRIMQAEGRQQ